MGWEGGQWKCRGHRPIRSVVVEQEPAESSWNQQHSATKPGTKLGTVQPHPRHHLGEMGGQRRRWRGHRGVLWCCGGWWHCWRQCLRWLPAGWACALGQHHKMLQASESLWRCWSAGAAQPWPPAPAVPVLCAAVPWWLPSHGRASTHQTPPGEWKRSCGGVRGQRPLSRHDGAVSVCRHCQGWERSS